ncbi:DEAD/DEAH box helicase [Jonesia quinghaiensis]|uniref:DEAD/DEAH box helicase n=1 Tax=Jonesia quinghaiensis TaxID=262806 RepID=UPI00048DB717|nr:DEAD/DEAH box helicase [Jonesia quinghaiensis]
MSPKRSRAREQRKMSIEDPTANSAAVEASPAQRYQRFKEASTLRHVRDFTQTLSFPLDDFQVDACQRLEAGDGVLVAAPTGAGKTIVGEFAVYLALKQHRKAFYTTPIKALSNQKYQDFQRVYGAANVGLLTGDTTINGEAPIVVMTTEVLRNMIYAESSTLNNLGYVIMDEVHYLADRFRGAVWEEVIIHLERDVQLVSLSATVSNAEEFGDWLAAVRGSTAVIVSERRPVPLWQHVITQGRGDAPGGIIDLYAHSVDPTDPGPTPPINPELLNYMRRGKDSGGPGRDRRGRPQHSGRRGPPRFAVINALEDANLLPAIYFLFSRAGCDAAVEQCLATGISLTTEAQAQEIQIIVETRIATLPTEDLQVLGYFGWLDGLMRGIAAHHAGMLPLFKEVVEELFSRGLIKVVFATETLALGINMPARTVVLEKLVKWNGTAHVDLTPGEYTQLTGRAGRRGIDVEGHAVVVDHVGLDPMALVRLASRRLYPLRSSFTPTYNMAVNLVDRFGYSQAREILETSFAQFQADRGVVDLARQAQANSEALEGYTEAMQCDRGDFSEYMRLRSRISEREKELSRVSTQSKRNDAIATLSALRVGDIAEIPSGRSSGRVLVLDRGKDTGFEGRRPLVLTEQGKTRVLTLADVPNGVEHVGSIRISPRLNARKPSDRRDLTREFQHALRHGDLTPAPTRRYGGPKRKSNATSDSVLSALKDELRYHPCHKCPDRDHHARWGERWAKLTREHTGLLRRIEGRTGSIAKTFDRICAVLNHYGYLNTDNDQYTVTSAGLTLQRIYAENDLLIAQCLNQGIWDKLDAPQLAAAVSAAVYQSRGEEHAEPHIPGGPEGKLARSIESMVRIWGDLTDTEEAHQLEETGDLDAGLVWAIHAWTRGRNLDAVLSQADLTAGDFVRWAKQILDALDHIANVAPQPAVQSTARSAIDAIRRGVVDYSSM